MQWQSMNVAHFSETIFGDCPTIGIIFFAIGWPDPIDCQHHAYRLGNQRFVQGSNKAVHVQQRTDRPYRVRTSAEAE
jgi:hypothetical protein